MTLIATPRAYIRTFEKLGRAQCNGAMPDAYTARILAHDLNHLLSWGRIIPGKAVALAYADDVDAAAATWWRFRYQSSLNGTAVHVQAGTAPSSAAAGSMPTLTYADGAATFDAPVPRRGASPTDSDLRPESSRTLLNAAVPRDAIRQITVASDNFARPCDFTAWEAVGTPDYLDDATDTLVDPRPYHAAGAISDGENGDLRTNVQKAYNRHHKMLVAWCVDRDDAPHMTTSAVHGNLFDHTIVAYDAHTPGWFLDVLNCGTYTGTAVTVTCWVWAGMDNGIGNGEVRVTTSAAQTTQAITGGMAWWEMTVDADPTNAAEKLDVTWKGDGVNGCKVGAVSAVVVL